MSFSSTMHVISQFNTCSSNCCNNNNSNVSITTTKHPTKFHRLDNIRLSLYNNNHSTKNHHRTTSKITCKILINPSKKNTKIISPLLPSKSVPLPKPKTQPPPPPLPMSPPPDHQTRLNPLQRLVASALDVVEKTLVLDKENRQPLRKTVDPNIQLSGNYAPVQESPVRTGLEVLGEIPTGLQGVYVRNGANPLHTPTGAHHLFDGDGMIHAVSIGPGNQATHSCRFTQTNRLVHEKSIGKNLFPKPVGELHGRTGLIRLGLFYARAAIGLVDLTRGIGVANAGLIYFNGRLLAMSEDDLPYHVKMVQHGHGVDLETIGRFDFDGQVNCPLIAHPKVDPNTGDLHTLSYDVLSKPYLKYFRFNKEGRKSREVSVPLPRPTMVHDFAMTKNFVVIPDNQVVFDLSEMVRGGSPLRFDSKKKARFGILPKEDIDGSRIQWIDVPNSFCFHFMNAWEEKEGKSIVMIGSCMSPPDSIFNENNDDLIKIELCEIRFDLEKGQSTRRVIVSGVNLEIGQVNKHMLGQKTRYVYMAIAEPWPKCGGIAKVDVLTGKMTKFMYGRERYGGEPCFVPSKKTHTSISKGDEREDDDGWIMSFVRDENVERSELVILRAKDMKQIACVCMPSRVPYGFHGTFVDHSELSVQKDY